MELNLLSVINTFLIPDMTGFYLKGEYINLSQYFFFHLSSEKKEHSEKEREKFLSLYLPSGVVKKKIQKVL